MVCTIYRTFIAQRYNKPDGKIVASRAVAVGNVLWMLVQEGRSSNFRLRRGVGQAAHTRNNPHVKFIAVY